MNMNMMAPPTCFVRTPRETRLLIPMELRGKVMPVEVESVRVVDAVPRQGETPWGQVFWFVMMPLDQFTAEQAARLRREMATQHDVPLEMVERSEVGEWLAVLVDPARMVVIDAAEGDQVEARLVTVNDLAERPAPPVTPVVSAAGPAWPGRTWWRRLVGWPRRRGK